MANFTEETSEKIEVIAPWDVIKVRFQDIVKKDGVVVGNSFRRHTATPGSPVTAAEHQSTYGHTKNYSAKVEKIASTLWDVDSINKYQDAHPEEKDGGLFAFET